MGRKLDEGFTFLDSHAQLDEDHTEKLKNLFMLLNKTHDEVLLNSVETNFYLFKNILSFNRKDGARDTVFLPEDSDSLVIC